MVMPYKALRALAMQGLYRMSSYEGAPTRGPQVTIDKERGLKGEEHAKAESRVCCNLTGK
jgi:hypothetical protein